MQCFKTVAVIAAAAGFLGISLSTSAMADTAWQKAHPRREQVNHRLAKQNQRINRKVADGQMTQAQGAQLHKDDHQIRQEERAMSSQNDSHVSGVEDRALNQQENAVSSAIHAQ